MFSEQERHEIDAAYGKLNRGESLEPAEVELVTRFEVERAKADAEQQAKLKAIEDECAARIEESKKNAEIARETLKANLEYARARLKAVQRNV